MNNPGEHTLGKQLEVRLYDVKVGTLHGAPGNGLVFQYDPNYIASPEAVPLGTRSALDEKTWPPNLTRRWFEGLLPEGARRYQLARQLGIVHIDTWSLLEAAGSECAGAVQIIAPDYQSTPKLFDLDEDTLDRLLRPATEPIDEHHRAARLSLAGAQNKIVFFRQDGGPWQLPVDGHPSTHILKPAQPDFPALVQNEHWCMEVAKRAGIDTARTSIEKIGDIDVLVIERYDRTHAADGKLTRIHQEDLAQALGSRTKYQDEGFPNTYHLANVPGVDPGALFDRLILNWLIGNCDAHAKNYSILEPGTPKARLAPGYDIVSTEAYDLSQVMGTSIGNTRVLNEVTENAIEHMGGNLEVESPTKRAASIAQRMQEAVASCEADGIARGPVPVHRIKERMDKVMASCRARETRVFGGIGARTGPPSDAARWARKADQDEQPQTEPRSTKRKPGEPEH